MAWEGVRAMFKGVAETLSTSPDDSGLFFLYGPFNINGHLTSEGNRSLDEWAKVLSNWDLEERVLGGGG